jgi:hypothetical protein
VGGQDLAVAAAAALAVLFLWRRLRPRPPVSFVPVGRLTARPPRKQRAR